MGQYHGVKPPTLEEAKMANNHLDRTIALDKSKIAEHKGMRARIAKMSGNHKDSLKYEDNHIDNHEDDVKERQQSKKTLQGLRSQLKPLAAQMEKK